MRRTWKSRNCLGLSKGGSQPKHLATTFLCIDLTYPYCVARYRPITQNFLSSIHDTSNKKKKIEHTKLKKLTTSLNLLEHTSSSWFLISLNVRGVECRWIEDVLGSCEIQYLLAGRFPIWSPWPIDIHQPVTPFDHLREKHHPEIGDLEPCWLCQVSISPAGTVHYRLGAPSCRPNRYRAYLNLLVIDKSIKIGTPAQTRTINTGEGGRTYISQVLINFHLAFLH